MKTRCKFSTFSMVIAYIFFVTFVIILPLICGDWGYSWYFSSSWTENKMIEKASYVNIERLRSAQAYLSARDPKESNEFHQQNEILQDVDLAIGVVSVKRLHANYELGYLIQVMVQLERIFIADNAFNKKVMYLCNADAGPGEHVEASDLSRYFLYRKRFQENNPAESTLDPFEKEKKDYVFCLQNALKWNPDYILILEDDALPRPNLFPVLKSILGRISHQSTKWSYLKLYHPERWQGYSFELNVIIELVVNGLIGACLVLFLSKCFCIASFKRKRVMIFISAFVYFMLLCLAIGRPYLLKWRHLHPSFHSLSKAPECCTPAMVYPKTAVHSLLSYLNKTKCSPYFPIDKALAAFSRSHNLETYITEPNLVNHIGLFSTIKGGAKFPRDFV